MTKLLPIALWIAAASLPAGAVLAQAPDAVWVGDWSVRTGDTALPPGPGDAWIPVPVDGGEAGVRWYARDVRLEGPAPAHGWSLLIRGLDSAWELWWDERPVDANGTVGGSIREEEPGRWMATVTLPSGMTAPGTHRVAIRASAARGSSAWREPHVRIAPADGIAAAGVRRRTFSLLSGGVFLTAAVFCLALFLGGGRQRPYLLFGLHLVTCLATVVFGSGFVREAMAAPSYRALLPLGNAMIPLGGFLLIAFFVRVLGVPRARLHTGLAVPASVLPGLVAGAIGTIYVVLTYVLGLLGWAVARRRPGAVPALVGVLGMGAGISTLRLQLPHAEYLNTAGLLLFIFSIAISTSRQLRVQNREHEAARLRSARLEADLLKRSIQPHFLMNTLLSVMSWIRRDPATATRLIQALADEFRHVNRVSAETAIPLEEEIELCRTHLTLMGYRNDAAYDWTTEGDVPGIRVPPLVLHTLVENGLTHALGSGENGAFVLRCEREEGRARLVLRSGGSRLAKLAGRSAHEIEEGFGLRYVKARLEESFPGRWSVECGLRDGSWETVIGIPQSAGAGG